MEEIESAKSSKLLSVVRWLLFIPVLLILAGALLEGKYLTGFLGILLAFFLTVHQDKVKNTLKSSYILILIFAILIFLVGSYIDMKGIL